MSSEGALVLVVGPSGAGKDSVLRGARAALAGDDRIRFARRCITRPPSPDEDNLALSPDQFTTALGLGSFLLSWEAHGLRYGLPASLGLDLAQGACVVANVSRAIVDRAREVWPRTLAVLVTAPSPILRARLDARGRDADIDQRLVRARLDEERLRPDLTISNDGALDAAISALTRFIDATAAQVDLAPSRRDLCPGDDGLCNSV